MFKKKKEVEPEFFVVKLVSLTTLVTLINGESFKKKYNFRDYNDQGKDKRYLDNYTNGEVVYPRSSIFSIEIVDEETMTVEVEISLMSKFFYEYFLDHPMDIEEITEEKKKGRIREIE